MPNKRVVSPEEFAALMHTAAANNDPESGHIEMDGIMCDLLESLGYGDGIEALKNASKWYA